MTSKSVRNMFLKIGFENYFFEIIQIVCSWANKRISEMAPMVPFLPTWVWDIDNITDYRNLDLMINTILQKNIYTTGANSSMQIIQD